MQDQHSPYLPLDEATRSKVEELSLLGIPKDDFEAVDAPADAGHYSTSLEVILRRIPEDWGRSLRVEKGWYPLIVELDVQLNHIFPHYELYQVKEKFGGLRYYWEPNEDKSSDTFQERLELADQIVATAEAASLKICQRCSAPAKTIKQGFKISTLCSDCSV